MGPTVRERWEAESAPDPSAKYAVYLGGMAAGVVCAAGGVAFRLLTHVPQGPPATYHQYDVHADRPMMPVHRLTFWVWEGLRMLGW